MVTGRKLLVVWLCLWAGVVLMQCEPRGVPILTPATPTCDNNLALGNPDGAVMSATSPNAYLITRVTYSLSYNNATGIANCRAAGRIVRRLNR